MNRGIDCWVSFSFTHPPSLHLQAKFMKKNQSHMIVSTWRKQVPITYISLGLLQWNKDFQTPLEQANKMMSRFLLLSPSFTKKEMFKKFTEFFQQLCKYAPNILNALCCKFRLGQLYPVFADLVTIVFCSCNSLLLVFIMCIIVIISVTSYLSLSMLFNCYWSLHSIEAPTQCAWVR